MYIYVYIYICTHVSVCTGDAENEDDEWGVGGIISVRCLSGAKVTLGCPWGVISTGGPPHRRVDLSHRKQRFRDKNLL